MACPICNSNKKDFTIRVRDFEYNIKYYAQYAQCSFCNSLYRNKPKKINRNLSKILYSSKNYLPIKGNHIYDFLKILLAKYEKSIILSKLNGTFLNKKKTILDIACGKGYLVKEFSSNKIFNCYGIDVNVATKNVSNIEFIKSSYKNTTLIKKVRADLIIINNFIEHIDDLNIIKKIIAKMKKGSSLVVLTPDGNSNGKRYFSEYWSGYHSPRHKNIFNCKSIKFFLKNNNKIKTTHFKIYDPFTNLISIVNAIKYGCIKLNIFEILRALTFIPFIFVDIFNKNRIFTLVKKI